MACARDNRAMRKEMVSLIFALLAPVALASRGAAALESRTLRVADVDYRVVRVDLKNDALDLYWLDADGRPYGSIDALKRDGEARGQTLQFAINAGIYDRSYRPLGLAIGAGRVLRPLNLTQGAGAGNFGLQPNGIFHVDREGHAGVIATTAWRENPPDVRVATQSGPMLLIDGAINPNFLEQSDSRKWRSGVCAVTADQAVFVVSERAVTFHAFASVFRDGLGCRDALYLDGTLSQIYTASDGYAGAPALMVRPYAGMLAVFASAPASR
jgi:uncharacterized protein YigE (DUF2233 family)